MTKSRFTPANRRTASHVSLHDRYVRAINAALHAGDERVATELAASYAAATAGRNELV